MKNCSKASYSAFDTAIYYLTFKDRCEKELISKLKEKGYSDFEIDETVEKLVRYGYLNDERYALSYIKSHMNNKGKRRIAMELYGKGVDSDITNQLINEVSGDESEVVFHILERRYSKLDYADETQVRRMYAYFSRRGFRYEDIRQAVSKYRKNIEKI